MKIRELDPEHDMAEWLRLRQGLFPDDSGAEHRQDMADILTEVDASCVFVAERPSTKLAGYLFIGSRKYAEGRTTSPVSYLKSGLWMLMCVVRAWGKPWWRLGRIGHDSKGFVKLPLTLLSTMRLAWPAI